MSKILKELNKTLNKNGLDSNKLSLIPKLVYCMHLLPSLIKDGHCISLGGAGIGKTTTIKNGTSKFKNISKATSASLFGNLTKKENGYISDLYDVVAIEQISSIKSLDEDLIGDLLTHCNGDNVDRLDKPFDNRTSLVFLGNCNNEYTIQICDNNNTIPIDINNEFFNVIPDDFRKEQGLERFIIIPSFHLEKISTSSIVEITDNNFKNEISKNRISFTKYTLEDMSVRAYKAHCKIITTLNFFLNNNAPLNEDSWLFKGFKAFASSIVNISTEKEYQHFYYRNEDGRKLALVLILDHLPKDDIIEEAHFLKNRALIKLKDKNYWYKVPLNHIGEHENKMEYDFYNKNTPCFISRIIDISKDSMILTQDYIPLESNFFKVKNLDFLYNNNENELEALRKVIEKQKTLISKQTKEIKVLKQCTNNIITAFNFAIRGGFTALENPFLTEYKEKDNKKGALNSFIETLTSSTTLKATDIKKRNYGFKENKFLLVNFTEIFS